MPIKTPIEFKRGQSFSFIFNLPPKFDPGFFADWEISSQIRKFRNTEAKGLIADVNASWVDGPYANTLLLYNQTTDDWDLGDAELDVKFTSPSGHIISTETVLFKIVQEITQ